MFRQATPYSAPVAPSTVVAAHGGSVAVTGGTDGGARFEVTTGSVGDRTIAAEEVKRR